MKQWIYNNILGLHDASFKHCHHDVQCSHRRMCHVPLFSPSHHHRAIWWVLSKNSNKRYGTKYCKWISVRASSLSPFINEQVFVSRQCTQVDSIRLLDKWLLHLLQRARRKHISSGKGTSEWKDRSLCCSSTAATTQYTTTAHRRSSSTAAPLQPIHQLQWPKEGNLRDCWLSVSDEVLSWSETVSS